MSRFLLFLLLVPALAICCEDTEILVDASWSDEAKVWMIENAAENSSRTFGNDETAFEVYKSIYSEGMMSIDGPTFYKNSLEKILSCEEIKSISKIIQSALFKKYLIALETSAADFSLAYEKEIEDIKNSKTKELKDLLKMEQGRKLAVVVPSGDIKAGEVLSSDKFSYREFALYKLEKDAVLPSEWEKYMGKVMKNDLKAGQPLLERMVE